MNRTQKLKVEAGIDLSETPEEKTRRLSKVPSPSWGKNSRFLAPRPVSLPLSHMGLPEPQTASRLTKQQAREPCHMNGQIVEGQGGGEKEHRAEGHYGFTEIYLQVDPGVTPVAAPEKERLTDSTNKGRGKISQREIQESQGFVHITNTLHQVETKNNSEEKPTIHKGPFILWAFLLHTHFT